MSDKLCPDCEALKKRGGAGLCSKCAQAVIDKNPDLQVLQKKGKAFLEGFARGNSKYGGKKNADESAFRSALSLSADSPEQLRSSDVDRVMSDAASRGFAEEFRRWLLSKGVQSDTAAEIKSWTPEG